MTPLYGLSPINSSTTTTEVSQFLQRAVSINTLISEGNVDQAKPVIFECLKQLESLASDGYAGRRYLNLLGGAVPLALAAQHFNIHNDIILRTYVMRLLKLTLETGLNWMLSEPKPKFSPLTEKVAGEIQQAYQSILSVDSVDHVLTLEAACVEGACKALLDLDLYDTLADIMSAAAKGSIGACLTLIAKAQKQKSWTGFSSYWTFSWASRVLGEEAKALMPRLQHASKVERKQLNDTLQTEMNRFFEYQPKDPLEKQAFILVLQELCRSPEPLLFQTALKRLETYTVDTRSSFSRLTGQKEEATHAVRFLAIRAFVHLSTDTAVSPTHQKTITAKITAIESEGSDYQSIFAEVMAREIKEKEAPIGYVIETPSPKRIVPLSTDDADSDRSGGSAGSKGSQGSHGSGSSKGSKGSEGSQNSNLGAYSPTSSLSSASSQSSGKPPRSPTAVPQSTNLSSPVSTPSLSPELSTTPSPTPSSSSASVSPGQQTRRSPNPLEKALAPYFITAGGTSLEPGQLQDMIDYKHGQTLHPVPKPDSKVGIPPGGLSTLFKIIDSSPDITILDFSHFVSIGSATELAEQLAARPQITYVVLPSIFREADSHKALLDAVNKRYISGSPLIIAIDPTPSTDASQAAQLYPLFSAGKMEEFANALTEATITHLFLPPVFTLANTAEGEHLVFAIMKRSAAGKPLTITIDPTATEATSEWKDWETLKVQANQARDSGNVDLKVRYYILTILYYSQSPHLHIAYLGMSITHGKTGIREDLEKSITYAEHAVRLQPDAVEPLRQHARAHLKWAPFSQDPSHHQTVARGIIEPYASMHPEDRLAQELLVMIRKGTA